MKIILYKKCILNSNYTEVFRDKELLNNYLTTLVNKEITINDAFYNLSGVITVKFDNTKLQAFDYNYMKIISENANIENLDEIFCFINNIDVSNNMALIDYTCDYWSTFNDKFSLRESLMSYSRLPLKNNYPHYLPLKYESNSPTILNTYGFESGFYNSLRLVVELQIFDSLAQAGEIVPRITKTVLFDEALGIRTIDTLIDFLSANENQKTYHLGEVEAKYFEMVNLYIIPDKWAKSIIESPYINKIHGYILNNNIGFNEISYSNDRFVSLINLSTFDEDEHSEYINDDYRKHCVSFGFYTTQFPYVYNGYSKKTDFLCYIDSWNFNIYMQNENGLQEITELFSTELNFKAVSAEAIAQQKLQRKVQTAHGIGQAIAGASQIAGGILNLAVGGGTSGTSMTRYRPDGSVSSRKNEFERGAGGSTGGAIGSIGSGVSNMISGIANIASANANQYVNSSIVDNFNMAKLNAYYGFCFLLLDYDKIINKEQVESCINEVGYKVNYFVNTIDIDESKINELKANKYNVIKFDFVRINGISTNINNIIENILINGVKIWYSVDV